MRGDAFFLRRDSQTFNADVGNLAPILKQGDAAQVRCRQRWTGGIRAEQALAKLVHATLVWTRAQIGISVF